MKQTIKITNERGQAKNHDHCQPLPFSIEEGQYPEGRNQKFDGFHPFMTMASGIDFAAFDFI